MTSTTSITYRLANYSVPFDANEVVHLLNSHAKETSSSSSSSTFLPPPKSKLQKQLQLHAANDSMFSILAVQNQSKTVIGIQHCFVSFSCAECRPVLEVLNTHVLPSFKREGMDVEERLHEKSEEEAKRRRCCKIVMMEKVPVEMPYQKVLEVRDEYEGDDGAAVDARKKCSACSTLTETLTQSTMMSSWQICNACVAREQAASAYDVRYSGR